ncbi:MAG: hypothetical protein AAF823_05515 [Planctomycetota bacterium]
MSATGPDQPHSTDAPGKQVSPRVEDRRAFLKLAGRKAVYVAPAVATLAAASRANAASSTSPS